MPDFNFVPETPTPVGLQKQLFVDDYIVAEKNNVSLGVGEAKKHGVVMEPTLVTDFQSGEIHDGPDGGSGLNRLSVFFSSPHWDSDKAMFRLWYMAGQTGGYRSGVRGIGRRFQLDQTHDFQGWLQQSCHLERTCANSQPEQEY